jgi:endonuclease YncB( thermonuclease family)
MPGKISYKKISSLTAVILLIITFISWIFDVINPNPTQQKINKEPAEFTSGKIISGIAFPVDGDSIKINQESVRLVGIDAPEYKQKCLDKNYQEYNCGEISSKFLNNLIRGKNIICHYEEKDMYNRYLGICYLDKININQEILRSGMAIIYNPATADDKLKQLELEARTNKIGIWQGSFLEPKEYRRKNKHKKHHVK